MHAAVVELAVVETHLLGRLACLLGHAGHGLAVALALLHLLENDVGHLEVAVEVVVKLAADEVAHILGYAHAVGRHLARAEPRLGLRLEHRLLDLEGHGGHHAVADVGVLEVASEVVLDGAADGLLEGAQVRAALGGVLAVDEGIVLLAVLVDVRDGHLDILPLEMDDRIERSLRHDVAQEVDKALARHVAVAVEDD